MMAVGGEGGAQKRDPPFMDHQVLNAAAAWGEAIQFSSLRNFNLAPFLVSLRRLCRTKVVSCCPFFLGHNGREKWPVIHIVAHGN